MLKYMSAGKTEKMYCRNRYAYVHRLGRIFLKRILNLSLFFFYESATGKTILKHVNLKSNIKIYSYKLLNIKK